MKNPGTDKRKIFNDPVYGFITIPNELSFDLIEHPFFQRLRRIKQLGMTHLVYPGALHTRFQHSIGAMHLMSQAIASLRSKGHEISKIEESDAEIAILLHDIGHGPFSHALENSLIRGVSHEDISLLYMTLLDEQYQGKLGRAIEIFKGSYDREFLHQLVSGQLDMDRLDYLKRDSFFCGVAEGIVNNDRIIRTLNLRDNSLVIDVKGIYSVENFIIARRLMYWQVYLHKTVIAAESLLIQILRRARKLIKEGEKLFASPSLEYFLKNNPDKEAFLMDPDVILHFSQLDDFDIYSAIKVWANSPDKVLAILSNALVNRQLFRIEMQNDDFDEEYVQNIRKAVQNKLRIPEEDLEYFVFRDTTSNYAVNPVEPHINVLLKDGRRVDFTEASEQLDVTHLSQAVTKHLLAYPKKIEIVNN